MINCNEKKIFFGDKEIENDLISFHQPDENNKIIASVSSKPEISKQVKSKFQQKVKTFVEKEQDLMTEQKDELTQVIVKNEKVFSDKPARGGIEKIHGICV